MTAAIWSYTFMNDKGPDGFPPPVFTLFGPLGWVPTIELTVQVRRRPCPGPVQVRFRTRYLSQGVMEEDGELWDSSGELVALSRQSGKVRVPAERVRQVSQ